MVRPMPEQARPVKTGARLENSSTDNIPVGDGSWIQPSEEPIDSNDDITIDPQILSSLLNSTSMRNAPVNQPAPAVQAIQNISKRVEERPMKAVEPKKYPKATPKLNASRKVTESSGRKSPAPAHDSSLEGKDQVDYADINAVGNSELHGIQTSKGNDKKSSDFQVPTTNYFSSDYQYPEGVQRDVAAQGRDLYLRFLHEEMRVVRVREPPCMDPWRAARLDLDYSVSLNASVRIRKSLRQMADAFACSEHRERVRERAARVDLEMLNLSTFNELLVTLFQDGSMTSERIIVLFYFCADLTIRALTEQLIGCFHQLIEWSQLYIVDNVSVWVQQNGGWAAVLEQSSDYIYKAAKIALVCATVVALFVYIRKAR